LRRRNFRSRSPLEQQVDPFPEEGCQLLRRRPSGRAHTGFGVCQGPLQIFPLRIMLQQVAVNFSGFFPVPLLGKNSKLGVAVPWR